MKVFDRLDNNKCSTPDQWCAVYNEDLKDGPQVKLCGFLHTLIFLWNIFIFTLQILLDDLIIYLGKIFKSDISRKMKNVFQAVIKYTVELLKSRNVIKKIRNILWMKEKKRHNCHTNRVIIMFEIHTSGSKGGKQYNNETHLLWMS